MRHKHPVQYGIFHITTCTVGREPACTYTGVPERILHHLIDTRNMQDAKLHAFCILPDHIHILCTPGPKGLSKFVHAFKKNSSREFPELHWQKGFNDQRMRSARQYALTVDYVQRNALRHGLVKHLLDWPWSSLHYGRVLDLMEWWD